VLFFFQSRNIWDKETYSIRADYSWVWKVNRERLGVLPGQFTDSSALAVDKIPHFAFCKWYTGVLLDIPAGVGVIFHSAWYLDKLVSAHNFIKSLSVQSAPGWEFLPAKHPFELSVSDTLPFVRNDFGFGSPCGRFVVTYKRQQGFSAFCDCV
jgi:hypothetical protein